MTSPPPPTEPPSDALREARLSTLHTLDRLLDRPMTVLSFVWLGLLVLDLVQGLPPGLQTLSNVIWALFILDFLLSFALAPDKGLYLRRNWLTLLSLLLPALRILRAFRGLRALRALRLTRGTNLLRLLTSLNRGLRTLGRTLRRRGLGFVLGATGLVALAGAAGMASFEAGQPGAPGSYGEWLYWVGMLLTSLGSEYWPRTGEGRVLTFVLALYGFSVFGYITATLASFFVGDDQEREPEGDEVNNEALRREMVALREELAALRGELKNGS
ncbi:potassium channel family protein [Deinococcus budaensis]|uniref:Voltage-gated potassium channel n=1 Tax=Deinococcus budaensis TaxID=1665626 RepID=A0A7W8GID5_9DEIO|nr:potassium channel family protein [Deinococcus budaensis]MBB5236214.1 voltage-gated potassium channel [Deinococcus budaensis]